MIIERQVEAKMKDDEGFAYFVTESLLKFFEKDWGDTAAYDVEGPGAGRPIQNGSVLLP